MLYIYTYRQINGVADFLDKKAMYLVNSMYFGRTFGFGLYLNFGNLDLFRLMLCNAFSHFTNKKEVILALYILIFIYVIV